MTLPFESAVSNGRLVTALRPQGYDCTELAVSEIATDHVPGFRKGDLVVGYLYGPISRAKVDIIQRVDDTVPLPQVVTITDTRQLRFVGLVGSDKMHAAAVARRNAIR